MNIYAWSCTDTGMKRKQNEDSALVAHDLKLFAVADGMGGHKGGATASSLAVRALEEHVRRAGDLGAALARANALIYETAKGDRELEHMGTTTSSLFFKDGKAWIAHVGDSRVYLIRHGRIVQLTEDHSLVWQQMKAGTITAEQARTSPFKNIISRSVGIEPHVDIDLISVGIEPGDAFLICSDGLSNHLEDDEILQVVQENFLHRVPELLVEMANARGGTDNITVVTACVLE